MGIESGVRDDESVVPLGMFGSGLFFGGPTDPSDDAWPEVCENAGPSRDLGDALGLPGRLRVCARVRSQSLARELTVVHEIAARYRTRPEFARDEVGHALGWSRSMALQRLTLAAEVIDRLPVLHALLGAGALDEVKVRTIAEQTRLMPDDLAREVTARVVPAAATSTVSTLIEDIAAVAVALDPDWAARREQAARRRVRVVGTHNPTGTTDVSMRDLHPAYGTAIMARVEALAAVIKAGAAARGVRAPIHAVRALVSVRMQDGSCVGLDDDALIAALVDDLPAWLSDHGHDDPDSRHGDPPPDDSPPDDSGPDAGPGLDDPEPADADADAEAENAGAEKAGAENVGASAGAVGPGGARVRTGTLELRLRLSTALGLDDLPGQLPSWGTLTAPAARDMLARARDGHTPCQWRLVLTDDHGHLDHVVLAHPGPPPRRRPDRPAGPRRGTRRRGDTRGRIIVELAAATTMLAALDPDTHPAWAPWIRRAQTRLSQTRLSQTRPAEHAADVDSGSTLHPATTTADAHKRRPGRALDRWTRTRDRHCIGYLCTRAAHTVDLDHTHDWHHLGPTVAANLGGPCRHCHRLKHDGGWTLEQPAPGHFTWHSPLGATYAVTPRPVLTEPPAPAARADARPRPVLDIDPPCDDHDPPWIDRTTPHLLPHADVPPPPPHGPADQDHQDPPY